LEVEATGRNQIASGQEVGHLGTNVKVDLLDHFIDVGIYNEFVEIEIITVE